MEMSSEIVQYIQYFLNELNVTPEDLNHLNFHWLTQRPDVQSIYQFK